MRRDVEMRAKHNGKTLAELIAERDQINEMINERQTIAYKANKALGMLNAHTAETFKKLLRDCHNRVSLKTSLSQMEEAIQFLLSCDDAHEVIQYIVDNPDLRFKHLL